MDQSTADDQRGSASGGPDTLNEITTLNIEKVELEELRKYCFSMIELHVDYVSLDVPKFTYLLGYYPAIYNHFAELYTFLLGRVRAYTDAGNRFTANRMRDKKDILDEVLKSVKLQYESVSRKITILAEEHDDKASRSRH